MDKLVSLISNRDSKVQIENILKQYPQFEHIPNYYKGKLNKLVEKLNQQTITAEKDKYITRVVLEVVSDLCIDSDIKTQIIDDLINEMKHMKEKCVIYEDELQKSKTGLKIIEEQKEKETQELIKVIGLKDNGEQISSYRSKNIGEILQEYSDIKKEKIYSKDEIQRLRKKNIKDGGIAFKCDDINKVIAYKTKK
jgi:hypothetical protein